MDDPEKPETEPVFVVLDVIEDAAIAAARRYNDRDRTMRAEALRAQLAEDGLFTPPATPEARIESMARAIHAVRTAPDSLPLGQPLTMTGRFRVYFNRHGAAPLVWCVATDRIELAIVSLDITAPVRSVYRAKATPDDEDGKPSAWFEVAGRLVVDMDGHARIEAT